MIPRLDRRASRVPLAEGKTRSQDRYCAQDHSTKPAAVSVRNSLEAVPPKAGKKPKKKQRLGQGSEEFQAEKAQFPCGFLATDPGRNRRSLVGDEVRGRRRRRNGELNNLFHLKKMRGGYAGARGADV